jgi:acetylornithine deacetylase
MNAQKILEKLVAFDTAFDKENVQIMDWAEKFLKRLGFVCEKMQFDGKVALWGKLGKQKETGLVFVGHTDTVPAGENWVTDPLKLTESFGKFYGLGACDMKGGIAAFLAALEKQQGKRVDKNIEIVLTYDEEVGFSGIKNILKEKNLGTDIFLIGEPTNNVPVVAHKGILAMKMTFFGKSAHGSVPDQGNNAIFAAIEASEELKKFSEKMREKTAQGFDPACSTFNLAKISGGDAINKVPAKCEMEMEWRIIDKAQKKMILHKIQGLCKQFGAENDVLLSMDPVQSKKRFVSRIEMVLDQKSKKENYATEASFLVCGNVVILGPGPVTAHIANEFVSRDSLFETVKVYEKLIEYFCGR